MRKLNEQWIETIDGEEHMLKAVERHAGGDFNCAGCFFNDHTGKCLYGQECPICDVEHGYIKDLGIIKHDLLPCPFCGEYPEVYSDNDENEDLLHIVEHECDVIIVETGWRRTEQEAIDDWNRRV